MNGEDRKILGELTAEVRGLKDGQKEIKKDTKAMVSGLNKQDKKIAGLELQFSNHLEHHREDTKNHQINAEKRYRKQRLFLGGVVALMSIITAVSVFMG